MTRAFPYTMRVVSDILESNGSSSMAFGLRREPCAMDAGVPITAPVGGVAMGLVKEGDEYAILTDIAGAEDHYGDMDFKVAGTSAVLPRCRWISRSRTYHGHHEGSAGTGAQARAAHPRKDERDVDTPRTAMSQYAPRISL